MGTPSRTSPTPSYDIAVHADVGAALWALLAEYDLEGLTVDIVLYDVSADPDTLAAIVNRAGALGVAVVGVRAAPLPGP